MEQEHEVVAVDTEILGPVNSKNALVAETAFSSIVAFENAQRMEIALSKSDLVPDKYQGKVSNCLIALEMSQRLGMNPLMVMQNLYVVNGKPAWSSQFVIACINGCGKFSPLRYEFSGTPDKDDRACIAWAYDKSTNDRLESPSVSIAMAKAEGWFQKNGSKWKTMPELMLRYRSATFFGRTYSPELTMGMQTKEEIIDVGEARVVKTSTKRDKSLTPQESACAAVKSTKKATERAAKKSAAEPDSDNLTWLKDAGLMRPDVVASVLQSFGCDTVEEAAEHVKYSDIVADINAKCDE